jgi:adhesin/invasin
MKRILWSLLVLVSLVVSGCGAGGKINDPVTNTTTGDTTTGDTTTGDTTYSVTLSASPTTIGVGSQSNLQASVTKSSGDPASGVTVRFQFASGGDLSGGQFETILVTSDVNGRAKTIYTAGAAAGTDKIQAVAGTTTSSTVNIIVNTSTSSVGSVDLTSPNSTLIATGSKPTGTTGVLRVTVTDTEGKALAGQTVDFYPDAGSVTTPLPTDTFGKTQATFTAPNTLGTVSITASTGGVQSDSVSINITQGPPQTIKIYASPSTVGPAGTSTIKAILTDSNGFPVLSGTTASADLSVNNSVAELFPVFAATDSNGMVTFTDYYKAGINEGTDTVKVTSGTASNTKDIIVTAGAVTSLNSFTLSPSILTITADGTEFTTLTAIALDEDGNGVANETVNFTTTLGTLSAASDLTDDSGKTFVILTAGTTVGTARVLAQTDSGFADIKLIPFVAGPAAKVYLNAFPLKINAGETATVVATVLDTNDNAVKADDVVFQLQPDDPGAFSPLTVATDAGGRAGTTYTAGATPGTYTVSVLTSNSKSPLLADRPQITVESNTPASVTVVPVTSTISLGGSTDLTITVLDSNNLPVANQLVTLQTDSIGTVTPASVITDTDGEATATFGAGAVSGTAVVTATAGARVGTANMTITPGSAGAINLLSADPESRTIHIQQSLLTNTATLVYAVKDSFGNAAPNGTPVTFALTGTGTGGGEQLSVNGGAFSVLPVVGSTVSGQATVTLRSGTAPGVVNVLASINAGAVQTVARINIVGAMPDAEHISLAANPLNIAGGLYNNLESTITVNLADRYGNVPADGTVASFYSECGSIGLSSGFDATTTSGIATAILRSGNPRPGSDGRCNVVVTTTGDDSWDDANGNGVLDGGEICLVARGEPFIDTDGDGVRDASEIYIDTNKDGTYDGPGACSQNVVIWDSMDVMWSDAVASPNLFPNAFAINIGDKQTFIYDVQDINGNALVAGTTVTVTSTGGTLTGAVNMTLGDQVGIGSSYSFTLWGNPDPTAEPAPKVVEVTVTITPPVGTNNNGPTIFEFASGTIDN